METIYIVEDDINIREIESAIININAFANIMRQDITLEFAKNVIKDQIKEKKEAISLENIIKDDYEF